MASGPDKGPTIGSTRRPRDTVPLLDADRLANCDVLRGVGLSERRDIIRSGEHRFLVPGDVLIDAGETKRSIYFLLEGELGVHLDSIEAEPLVVLAAGETVGELSVLDGSPTSAIVVAREPSHLLELDEDAFWALTSSSHSFAVNLLVKLAERLRRNNAAVSENVRQRQRFEHAAMFDGLTGVHNRRWLDDTLSRMVLRRSQRVSAELAHGELSLAMLDIDHFKAFNDTYGHATGDIVLASVARVLSHNLRPTDFVARYGGEEFAIILPDTDLLQALRVAERVRVAVATQQLVGPDGATLPTVTVSIGAAQLAPEQSASAFLARADEALYRAKHAGRNRVEAWTEQA